jgi:CRP-like cAMP-binding protein
MSSARTQSSLQRIPASLIATPLFLSESVEGLADGAGFLNALSAAERHEVKAAGRQTVLGAGDYVFQQGEPHTGIFIIGTGRVRVFYTGPSGREVTLAYWTPGNFIGGPSIHGGGMHQWSGVAIEPVTVTALSTASLSSLMRRIPQFAICLIEGLEAKGRCYTAMAQMLGTRSVIERLAQLLLNLGALYGTTSDGHTSIADMITHDEIAALVGSTRQWVTMMLKRFKDEGVIATGVGSLTILKTEALLTIVRGEA